MNFPQIVTRRSLSFSLVLAVGACLGFTAQATPAAAATLKLSQSSLEAGQIAVGRTATLACTLTNSGPQSVTISKATLSKSVYKILSPTFPLTLASGKSAAVSIRFTPTNTQWDWATVTFASNAADTSLILQLNGGGVVAKGSSSGSTTGSGGTTATGSLSASRTSVSFGTVKSGTANSVTETVTNVGKAAVTISAAKTSGTGFSDTGITVPMTLDASHSVTFTVKFDPTAPGTDTGSLVLTSNAATKTLTVPLSGTSDATGTLAVSPTTASLGSVAVGSSKTMAATLTASGSSIVVSGATTTSSEFSVTGMAFPVTIAAGKTASFTVKFTPNSSGAATGKLSFTGDASNSPAVEALTGNGTASTTTTHTVALSWKASASSVSGYDVYRGTVSGGPFSKVNASLNSSTSYSDTTVQAGETYYYVVTGVNSSGTQSNYSNQVAAVVP